MIARPPYDCYYAYPYTYISINASAMNGKLATGHSHQKCGCRARALKWTAG